MKTVSLELSRKLKDAGYPQEGYFSWYLIDGKNELKINHPLSEISFNLGEKKPKIEKQYISPTADEILEQLPDYIRNPQNGDLTPLSFTRNKYTKDFTAQYHIAFSPPLFEQKADTLADVMAKMWLFLNQNGLLK